MSAGMNLTITLHWWMAVPAVVTLVWIYFSAGLARTGDLDRDTLPMMLAGWAATAGPAILAGWLA